MDRRVLSSAFFVFFALILFSAPIFGREFGYLNDYSIFESFTPKRGLFPETEQLLAIGRPLQAALLNLQLLFVTDLHSLQAMRLAIVAAMAGTGALFFLYLNAFVNVKRYSAILLSILVFTLPSMTINSFWVAQSIPGIVPVFLAIVAHFLAQEGERGAGSPLPFRAGAFVVLFLSFFVYPPATFFFLVLTFIKLIFGTKSASGGAGCDLRSTARDGILFFAACFAYFLSFKFALKPLLLLSNPWGMDFKDYFAKIDSSIPSYRFSLSVDPASKLAQLHDLFVLDYSAWFAPLKWYLIVPSVIGCGFAFSWAAFSNPHLKDKGIPAKVLWGLAPVIVIPVVGALPVLLAGGDYPILYRVTFAAMAVVPLAVVFVVDRAAYLGGTTLGWVLLLSFLYLVPAEIASHLRLSRMIARLSGEYGHVLESVRQQYPNEEKEIRIPPYAGPPDRAGLICLDFAYTAVNSITLGMVNAASLALGDGIDGYAIAYDPQGPRYGAAISDGIVFSRDGYPDFVSGYTGISGRESFGRWTDGKEAVIEFAKPLPDGFTLEIVGRSSSELAGRPVEIIVGNARTTAEFSKDESTRIKVRIAGQHGVRSIVFRFPDISSPRELGLSQDSRRLGLALIELKVEAP